MSETEELTTDLFKGFNSTDPNQLLAGLMRLFKTIASAKTFREDEMENVRAILDTTEFIIATQDSLKPRCQVIITACLDKLEDSKGMNTWASTILKRYDRK